MDRKIYEKDVCRNFLRSKNQYKKVKNLICEFIDEKQMKKIL